MAPGDEDKARPSLPPELVRMVRNVQEKCPELCEQNLSAFVSTAVRLHVLRIRRLGALEDLTKVMDNPRTARRLEALLLPDDD